MSLTAATATAVLTAAHQAAAARGVACSVSVVDARGHLQGFVRMDGAALAGIELSLSKARTSVLVGGISTAILAEAGLRACVRRGSDSRGSLAILPGGEPIRCDGILAGAVGVSGVAANSDVAIAVEAAAVAARPYDVKEGRQ